MRPAAALALALGLVGVGSVLWAPLRVMWLTAALLPAIFPSAPVDPLRGLAAEPSRADLRFSYKAGSVAATLFRPVANGRFPALILSLGAGALERSDLGDRFASALARENIVVLEMDSDGLRGELISVAEVDAYRQALRILADRTEVDPSRIGLVGLSAAGGLSILAAEAPDLRRSIRLVESFGGYSDAPSLLVDAASRSIRVNGNTIPWEPDSKTRDVLTTTLGAALTAGGSPAQGQQLLQAVRQGTTRAEAQRLVDELGPAATAELLAVSPLEGVPALAAHLYLMHDRDDPLIPYTQSLGIAEAAGDRGVSRLTLFSIFAHVIPDRPVPLSTFLPDLWALFWHVHAVLLDLTG